MVEVDAILRFYHTATAAAAAVILRVMVTLLEKSRDVESRAEMDIYIYIIYMAFYCRPSILYQVPGIYDTRYRVPDICHTSYTKVYLVYEIIKQTAVRSSKLIFASCVSQRRRRRRRRRPQ